MNVDDRIKLGAEALRDRYAGEVPDPEISRRRVLMAARENRRKRTVRLFVVLPLAAAFVGSTAWAGATGRLGVVVHAIAHAIVRDRPAEIATSPEQAPVAAIAGRPSEGLAAAERAEVPSEPTATATATATTTTTTTTTAPTTATATTTTTTTAPPRRPAGPGAEHPVVLDNAEPKAKETAKGDLAEQPAAPDPNESLYLEAHQAHFRGGNPALALAAWDRYLAAAPDGRFAPEARFNRAIALLKLGRRDEAIKALQPFASGTYGGYRRDDAMRLIEAADAGRR